MQVRVGFYGAVRDVAGIDEETIELPSPADVGTLVDRLQDKHGHLFTEKVFQGHGTIFPSVAILLNGVNISLNQGLDTSVENGDVVVIIPVIAGGSYSS